ncbi:MAG: hypothetical protein NTY13_00395 [Chlamydiae bacterium]|nr:hypothetical protein [Chlamydiota bacterium]
MSTIGDSFRSESQSLYPISSQVQYNGDSRSQAVGLAAVTAEFQARAASRMEGDFPENKERILLKCNWKMTAGIAVGVLVGLVVLGLIVAGVAASHGVVIPVLGLMAAKISSGALAAAKVVTGAFGWTGATATFASIIEAIGMAGFLLGVGGKIGGALLRSGEAESMDNFFKESSKRVKYLEEATRGEGNPISEQELIKHIEEGQSTVLASQAGRNFNGTYRMTGLHYLQSPLRSPLRFFGHFWASIPEASLRSISDGKQYKKYNENIDRELFLKKNSMESLSDQDVNNLNNLNELRRTRIEQYAKSNNNYKKALSLAPEALVYERNISRLQLLLKMAVAPSQKVDRNLPVKLFSYEDLAPLTQQVQDEINEQKKAKMELLKKRINEAVADQGGGLMKPRGAPLLTQPEEIAPASQKLLKDGKSFETIQEDIAQLATNGSLSAEFQGQILEAVGILLEGDRNVTISEVIKLEEALAGLLEKFKDENRGAQEWQSRESSIEYALKYTQECRLSRDKNSLEAKSLPTTLKKSEVGDKMTLFKSSHLLLRTLDVAIAAIHMVPVPGSAMVSLGLTAAAVALENG